MRRVSWQVRIAAATRDWHVASTLLGSMPAVKSGASVVCTRLIGASAAATDAASNGVTPKAGVTPEHLAAIFAAPFATALASLPPRLLRMQLSMSIASGMPAANSRRHRFTRSVWVRSIFHSVLLKIVMHVCSRDGTNCARAGGAAIAVTPTKTSTAAPARLAARTMSRPLMRRLQGDFRYGAPAERQRGHTTIAARHVKEELRLGLEQARNRRRSASRGLRKDRNQPVGALLVLTAN